MNPLQSHDRNPLTSNRPLRKRSANMNWNDEGEWLLEDAERVGEDV